MLKLGDFMCIRGWKVTLRCYVQIDVEAEHICAGKKGAALPGAYYCIAVANWVQKTG